MRACIFIDGENFRKSIEKLFKGTFNPRDYLPKLARWADFFDYIVAKSSNKQATRLRAYWYVIDSLDAWPRKFPKIGGNGQKAANVAPMTEGGHPLNTEADTWVRVKDHKQSLEEKNCKPMRNGRSLRSLSPEEIIRELLRRRDAKQKRFSGHRTVHRGIINKHNAVEFRHSGAIAHNLFSDNLGREKTVDVNLAVDMLQMRDIYDMAIIVSGDQDYLPAVQAVKNAGKIVVNVAFSDESGGVLPGGAMRLNEATDERVIVDYQTFGEYLEILPKADKK